MRVAAGDSVVGLTAFFEEGKLRSVGIQCALCHSTVDNSFARGIGRRWTVVQTVIWMSARLRFGSEFAAVRQRSAQGRGDSAEDLRRLGTGEI